MLTRPTVTNMINMGTTHKIIAFNIKRLMEESKITQAMLAKKTGISQRTISNIINPGSVGSITLATVEKLAEHFGLEAYHLIIPELPLEELHSTNIEAIMNCYAQMDKDGRNNIRRIAEIESRYSSMDRQTDRQTD